MSEDYKVLIGAEAKESEFDAIEARIKNLTKPNSIKLQIDPNVTKQIGQLEKALERAYGNNFKLDLDLNVDEKGLYMDARLQDDITEHRNIFNAIKSGLIDKQSFAFVVEEDDYDYDTDTRTITKIGKVYDVSVVDQPFYNATDVSVARNENDEFMEKRNELRKEHELKEELEKRKQDLLSKLG